MSWTRTLGRNHERLDTFPDEPQRHGQRARKRAERAELSYVLLQRPCRPMIERTAACGPALKEVEHAADDRLQWNRALVSCGRHRGDKLGNPSANTRCLLGLLLRVGAVRIGFLRIGGARFVDLAEAPEGKTVSGPAPPGFSTREHAGGLPGRKPLMLLDAHIARLQQAAEMSGRKICFNPVAGSQQRSARARERGGDARAQGDGPGITKRLLPHQGQMRVRGTSDLRVVQRDAGGQNPTKDFLNLRLAATGVKQMDLRLRSAARHDEAGRHQKRKSIRAWLGLQSLRAHDISRRGIETPGSSKRLWLEPFARQAIEERPLKRVPVGVWEFGPAVLRLDGTPIAMFQGFLIHGRHIGAALIVQKALVGRKQCDDLRVLPGRFKSVGHDVLRADTSHSQFAHRRPERLRQRWVVCQRPEVPALERKVQEEAHHQRWTKLLL